MRKRLEFTEERKGDIPGLHKITGAAKLNKQAGFGSQRTLLYRKEAEAFL